MRTTITLDDDVTSAVNALRHDRHVGMSEAVNELIREGLIAPRIDHRFEQRAVPMGLRLDVANVADAIEVLDGVHSR